jgi:hypothetical protein
MSPQAPLVPGSTLAGSEEGDEEGSLEWYATGLGLGRADVCVSWSNIASASNIQVLRLPILTGDWFLTDQIDVDRGRFRISRERDSALHDEQCTQGAQIDSQVARVSLQALLRESIG